jgi:ketosteroid isomerase-like protein
MGNDQAVVRTMFAAIEARDLEGAMAVLHPELSWSPTVWSGASLLRGKTEVRGWFEQFGPGLEHLRIDVSDLTQPAGWVVVCGVVHDTRGAPFTTRVGWNFAVQDGLVIEGRAFPSWEEALTAGGASADR